MSLVYEEYCLREERDGRPDTAEFCARYGAWKDSLESQLHYHRVLSRVATAAPAVPRFPGPGERFEQFLIHEELGRGGAGRVYRASDESLGGREVALKVSLDRGNEPSILGRLEHAHIVPVHSVVLHQDGDGTKLRGLCMAYRPGLPLDEVIRRVEPISRPADARVLHDALRSAAPCDLAPGGVGWDSFPSHGSYAEGVAWVVAVLAEALAYAHGRGVFHRDVKPANVLLTYREGPQLLDFNLSHDPSSAIEAEEAVRGGTLPYMAPEQLEAFLDPARWGDVAERADLYSLGLLMRELLTGRAPEMPDPAFPLPRSIRALLDRRADFRADLCRLNPGIPSALEAIAGRCLAFAPEDRYRDAGSLAEDLRRFLAHRPLKHARKRSPLAAMFLLVVTVSAVVAAAAVGFPATRHPGVVPRPDLERPEPVESRPELVKALINLEAGKAAAALDDLRTLGPAAWDSPTAVFLIAAAHARAGHSRDADEALQRFWSLPGADDVLAARSGGQAALAGHAEKLGRQVFTPGVGTAVLDRVERTFRLALRLDPGTIRAREGLAVVEQARMNYAAAHAILTGIIVSLGAPESPAHRQRLMFSSMTRARGSTLWAPSLPTPKVADAQLVEALGDLDRADQLVRTDDHSAQFQLSYIRCETLLARTRIAARTGRHGDAAAFFHEAEQRLAALESNPAVTNSPQPSNEAKLLARLRTEMPKIQALIQDHSPVPRKSRAIPKGPVSGESPGQAPGAATSPGKIHFRPQSNSLAPATSSGTTEPLVTHHRSRT